MNKLGTDPKVKKTLIRNYEQKVKPSARKSVIRDVACSSKPSSEGSRISQKENDLNQPTLCSSEALATYLSDVKKSAPLPVVAEDLNIDQDQLCSKMTKKLNFHINDKIYKNLIELNANVEEVKNKKANRLNSTTSVKRDLEPNIEDFYEEEIETDSPPNIPVIKPKFRPIKKVEEGHLHKLVAAFEDL